MGPGLALALALVLAAPAAQAHRLKLFATVEGAAILGRAYFAGGGPAVGIPGRLLNPDGGIAAEFRTDGDGRFTAKATLRHDYTLAVDAGDGHAATFRVGLDELPHHLPAGQASPAAAPPEPAQPQLAQVVEEAVARQVRPLREQLDAYEAKVRLHDILGGVGTILGVFGLGGYLAARRRSP